MNKLNNLLVLICVMLCGFTISAQKNDVNKEWSRFAGSIGEISRTASAIDTYKNLIVVGNTLNGSTTDVLVTKYNKYGNLIWQKTFDGGIGGSDYGVNVKIDASNNIYVAAAFQSTNGFDFGVLKYASNGSLVWSNHWNGNSNGIDVPTDIDIDSSGSVYLVGGTQSSNLQSDYAIVKFASNGNLNWAKTYDYVGFHDAATSINIRNNSIVVTGASASSPSNWDYVTLKVSPSNGQIGVIRRTEVAGVGLDNALAVTTDNDNNVYITGFVEVNGNKNIQTVKIDEDFELVWVRTFDGGLEDVAKALKIDNFGNVYLVGHTRKTNGGSRYITIKYDTDGNEVWAKEFGSPDGINEAKAENLALTDNGDIIVTGSVTKNGATNFSTVKYSPDGELRFAKEFDAGEGENKAEAVTVKGNDIYVSGTSTVEGVKTSTTVKYSSSERSSAVAIDDNGNEYVANRLIIRFDESSVRHETISKPEITHGVLTDFIHSDVSAEISAQLGFDCKNLKTYKIFRNLTPAHQTSISRLGDEVEIPHFWAILSIDFTNEVTPEMIESLNSMYPKIRYAERSPVLRVDDTPNDEFYADTQESLQDGDGGGIEMETAWDFEVGNSNIKVGVFDYSIFWEHEDFGDGTEEGSKVVGGWDFRNNVSYTESPSFDVGDHGTKCVGIIGALRNNEIGISGIAGGDMESDNTGAQLFSFGCGADNGSTISIESTFEAMVEAATDDSNGNFGYGIHVQNHSYGGPSFNNTQRDVIEFCWRNHSMVVTSRGNTSAANGSDNLTYPACYDDEQVISVMASGNDGQYMYEANGGGGIVSMFGQGGDFLAPGSAEIITSTSNPEVDQPDYVDNCDPVEGDYNCFRATSAASPHVAGVAALLCSQHQVSNGAPTNLTTEDVENILQNTAIDVEGLSEDGTFNHPVGFDARNGWGLINPTEALNAIDYPDRFIKHYDEADPLHIQETNDSQWILIESSYGLAAGSYFVDRWRVSWNYVEILPSNEIILDWWQINSVAHAGMNGANPNFGENNYFNIDENVTINGNVAVFSVFTFAYWVENSVGGQTIDKWIPEPPNQLKFAYSLHIEDTDATAISEIASIGQELNVYPNPTSDMLNISFNQKGNSEVTLRVYDAIGKLIVEQNMPNLISGENNFTINMGNVETGAYVISLSSDNSTVTKTFIKE